MPSFFFKKSSLKKVRFSRKNLAGILSGQLNCSKRGTNAI